jgi:hypothetical protein
MTIAQAVALTLVQACNPSISSSRSQRTNAMMYLDFGSRLINDLVNGGNTWSTWQVVFICNFEGRILWSYRCPPTDPVFPYTEGVMTQDMARDTVFDASHTRWHHPEWSNHPYFAASAIELRRIWGQDNATPPNYRETVRQERICIIDIKNSKTLGILRAGPEELVYTESTSGLCFPWLWVEVSPSFVEDSLYLPVAERPVNFSKNPSGRISMSNLNSLRDAKVNIVASDGRLIYTATAGSNKTIDLSGMKNLKSGTYFVKVESRGIPAQTIRYLSVQ